MTAGILEPGTLRTLIAARTAHALRRGALLSLPTESEFLEQGGVRFLVRILANLARKEQAGERQAGQAAASGKPVNPFLPYDEDLFVTGLTDTHLCLLNKYNVVDHHVLIVTRAFEDQQSPLERQDFEALWICLREFDSLGFYNAGPVAGASQPHKHLQLIPLPMAGEGPAIPMEPALTAARFQDSTGTSPLLPFLHAIGRFELDPAVSPPQAGETLRRHYQALRQAAGRQDAAYNLLVTRRWMLLVPRSRERFDAISVNALAFAGALLVRDEPQMSLLKEHGPMAVLKSVCF